MYIPQPYYFLRWLYPEAIFRLSTGGNNKIYLTFDDGPDPVSTPKILDLTGEYGIKAVFFCTGENALRYPGLLQQITKSGHVIANHGFSHLDGWKTGTETYVKDVDRASELLSSKIFRPPYGRLTPGQYLELKKRYTIFFWDIMPYDYDRDLLPELSYKMLCKKLRPGSVIALHDKAEASSQVYLRQFIEYSLESRYSFILPELH